MVALLVSAVLLAGGPSQSLEIRGSYSTAPLAEYVAETYMKDHPETIVAVAPCTACGLKSLILGLCDLVLWTDDGLEEDIATLADKHQVKLRATEVFRDAIVPVVDAKNKVADLTMKQLKAIFSGKVSNWKEVGGADAPIVVYTWLGSTSTFEVFKRHILGEDAVITPGARVLLQGSPWENDFDKNGIAYVGMTMVKKLKPLAVEGVAANIETVRSGKFPIVRHQAIYERMPETELDKSVLEYFLAPDKGQSFVRKAGNVPIH